MATFLFVVPAFASTISVDPYTIVKHLGQKPYDWVESEGGAMGGPVDKKPFQEEPAAESSKALSAEGAATKETKQEMSIDHLHALVEVDIQG
ncbi:hypothetical protein SUNI508_06644 [Seiridium unicorne]|uniref:Uncharacterized protein n=1 Tax=Seiridium unicorne TaxID=138068 RepID=A0ABR2V0T9_9PEZI